MNVSLYKVADKYIEICRDLFSKKDELSPEIIKDTLDSISDNIENKSINVASYYKNLQSEICAMKNYEKEMKKRRVSFENKANKIYEYLKSNMERCNIHKINGPEFTISIRNNPESVVIDDELLLSQEYITSVKINPNKIKIKSDIQIGKEVDGAHLERTTSLTIK